MADPRVLAAQFVPSDLFDGGERLDRIFVRDLVLPVEIGVFDHEKGVAQRVRFDVEAWVAPNPRPAEDDIQNVVSYDLLIEAVKELASGPHIELVETLAEQIAERCLAERRIARVRVRLEKLDLGPGAVGVEIERAQAPAHEADIHRLPLGPRRS